MRWETQAATALALIGGLLAGCGVIPSGIGFAVVFLIAGALVFLARRREGAPNSAPASAPETTRTSANVSGRASAPRPLLRVLAALLLGAAIGLVGHLVGIW